MRLVEATEPMFARHETFHPRYGWFRKSYTCVTENPRAFVQDDAPVRLGVGKNMVRAIRFWGLAAKLIEEDPQSNNRRTPDLIPTHLGHSLFGDNRWDPFMEDPGTLWLLHWLLLAPPCRLPVWWFTFNEFLPVEFLDDDLEAATIARLDAIPEWVSPHPSSVKKDISALLRTYAPAQKKGRIQIDDVLDCPLRELRLIGRSIATNRYRFTLGLKPSLPSAILAYCALDYIARAKIIGNTVTLGRLTHDLGAPGRAFKLTEGEFQEALEPIIDKHAAVNLTTTAGTVQLAWSQQPIKVGNEILEDYYGCSFPSIASGQIQKRSFALNSSAIQ